MTREEKKASLEQIKTVFLKAFTLWQQSLQEQKTTCEQFLEVARRKPDGAYFSPVVYLDKSSRMPWVLDMTTLIPLKRTTRSCLSPYTSLEGSFLLPFSSSRQKVNGCFEAMRPNGKRLCLRGKSLSNMRKNLGWHIPGDGRSFLSFEWTHITEQEKLKDLQFDLRFVDDFVLRIDEVTAWFDKLMDDFLPFITPESEVKERKDFPHEPLLSLLWQEFIADFVDDPSKIDWSDSPPMFFDFAALKEPLFV